VSLLFVSTIIYFKISNHILGNSSINFLKSFFPSIDKTSEFSRAFIKTSFLEVFLSKLASHKKSQVFNIASCFEFFSWLEIYFSTDKIQDFIIYKLLSIDHSSNNNSHLFKIFLSNKGLFSKFSI